MRATLERANLLKALSHVHRVVERRNTIPILSNVLLRSDGAKLRLKATDLDLEIVETIAAEIGQPGGTTVPAHMLYDIVRKLPDGSEVSLETSPDGRTMSVRSGRSDFTLRSSEVRDLIERTQFAISTEETRYYLNGIYLHLVTVGERKMLRAVATDGHRLAQAQIEAPAGSDGMPGVIVPRKTVGEIQKLIEGPDAEIRLEISETKIRLSFAEVVLTSKLIDGTFPDYGRVIPKGNDKVLKVDRGAFAEAVDRVSTIASERGRAVKLALSDSRLILSVNNPDSGSATEELGVEFDSEPLEIGFNAKYLLDIGSQLRSSTAVFRLADPGSPTLIQDDGDPDALFVLMPMRV